MWDLTLYFFQCISAFPPLSASICIIIHLLMTSDLEYLKEQIVLRCFANRDHLKAIISFLVTDSLNSYYDPNYFTEQADLSSVCRWFHQCQLDEYFCFRAVLQAMRHSSWNDQDTRGGNFIPHHVFLYLYLVEFAILMRTADHFFVSSTHCYLFTCIMTFYQFPLCSIEFLGCNSFGGVPWRKLKNTSRCTKRRVKLRCWSKESSILKSKLHRNHSWKRSWKNWSPVGISFLW